MFALLTALLTVRVISVIFVFIPDNEHIFLDMEEKLTKYFPKDWRQDSGKVRKLVVVKQMCVGEQGFVVTHSSSVNQEVPFSDLHATTLYLA